MSLDDKLNNIVSTVFGIPLDEINDSISYQTHDSWDSLNHMMLLGELEKEFNVSFSFDEAVSVLDIKTLRDVLVSKINK